MFSLILLLFAIYYISFQQTIKTKSFICLFLTLLASCTCYINKEIVFTQPWENGPYVEFTNSCLRAYFIVDIIHHCLQSLVLKKILFRKDLIFHHILILIPHLLLSKIIGVTFPIIAEIYATGSLFNLSLKHELIYRGIMIATVRLFVWIKLLGMAFIPNQQLVWIISELSVSTGMLLLDSYWFILIIKKLKN